MSKPQGLFAIALGFLALVAGTVHAQGETNRPNILFIAFDDLNNWIVLWGDQGWHLGGNECSVIPVNHFVQPA